MKKQKSKKSEYEYMKIVNRHAKEAAGQKNVHGALTTGERYCILREMHQLLKDIYYAKNYDRVVLENPDLGSVISILNTSLYLAESMSSDF